MAEQQVLDLALIGLGKQGLEHLSVASQCSTARFVAAVDPDPAAQERARAIAPGLECYPSASPLADLRLDGLVLALPHHCYVDCWQQLLALRLPMLKEKPLGRNQDEALALIDAARNAGCPVQTAIQRRHHPSYRMLAECLYQSGGRILEAHAHMHLGFPAGGAGVGWRSSRSQAGGGALLDAGYHLVDLLHFLLGPFDLVSSSLWSGDGVLGGDDIDDRAWLIGKSGYCWLMLDCWVSGETNPMTGKLQKSERVLVRTERALWEANREGVWKDGSLLASFDREWQQAMTGQLDQFVSNIRTDQWHGELIWDQLPAMRVIDQAYQLALRY